MSLQPYQSTPPLALVEQRDAPPSPVVQLAEWARSADAAYQVATHLVQTSFVPEPFRNKPHEATAAILAGSEVGLSPMAALRAFDVIQGVAAPRANTLRAIVQSRGHQIWVKESTATRAAVGGRRAGTGRDQESIWTMDRARQMGLTNKHNWKAQPQAMLVARATSEVCRLIAADAILGLSSYSIEELVDDAEPAEVDTAPTRPARTAQRKARGKAAEPVPPPAANVDRDEREAWGDDPTGPAGGPPLPGEDGYDDESAVEGVTKPQLTKLHTLFTRHGVEDRDDGLTFLSRVVRRQLTSSKELTKDEASRAIDRLERAAVNGQPFTVLLADLFNEPMPWDAPDADANQDPWAGEAAS